MNEREAIIEIWNSLVAVEEYFKNGIAEQLKNSASFGQEQAEPLHESRLILKNVEPLIPTNIYKQAEHVCINGFDQFNNFLSSLRAVVATFDQNDRKRLEEVANTQLNESLDMYRKVLNNFRTTISIYLEDANDDINNITQNITISGHVEKGVNIAGETINSPTIIDTVTLTINELEEKIRESDSSEEDKKSALKKINDLVKHPLVASILGGLTGGVVN